MQDIDFATDQPEFQNARAIYASYHSFESPVRIVLGQGTTVTSDCIWIYFFVINNGDDQ
jgi:hypothetical protein